MDIDSITASAASGALIVPAFASASATGSTPISVDGKSANQLHGDEGAGEPFYDEGAEILDRTRVFFVADARAAEGLDDLNALYVFDNGAVHGAAGLVVFCEAVAAYLEGQPHADEGQREGYERGEREPPVEAEQRNDAYNGQDDVPRALRNHVGERRLNVLDLIHHHALYLADGVVFHVAERRAEKAVGQP